MISSVWRNKHSAMTIMLALSFDSDGWYVELRSLFFSRPWDWASYLHCLLQILIKQTTFRGSSSGASTSLPLLTKREHRHFFAESKFLFGVKSHGRGKRAFFLFGHHLGKQNVTDLGQNPQWSTWRFPNNLMKTLIYFYVWQVIVGTALLFIKLFGEISRISSIK